MTGRGTCVLPTMGTRRLGTGLNAVVLGVALTTAGTEAASAGEPPRAEIDWNETHQTIVGFGGTMGWIHPHPEKREEVYDLLFKELGVSFLRIQALGGEDGDESTPEPENDNADANAFDWKKFDFKQTERRAAAVIQAARARGVKSVLPVTWSPPGWMKTTGWRAGGGTLKEENIAEYAELWTAYVLAMKRDFGVEIECLTIQNEPDLTYYYPTCRFEAELLARTMAAVRARIERQNLSVRVLGPDTCRIYNLEKYLEAMEKEKASPGTPALTHLYDLTIPFEQVDRDAPRWKEARELAARFKRPLWLVETANYLSNAPPATFDEAMLWAQKMHWALVAGDCEVVCYWQLFFDKKGEALVYCKKTEEMEYEITPKFYTSMNFFKFVRPGMKRCGAASAAGVLLSAFRSGEGEGGARVLVFVNPAYEDREIAVPKQAGTWARYTTTERKHCAREADLRDFERLECPPRSVTTLVHEAP